MKKYVCAVDTTDWYLISLNTTNHISGLNLHGKTCTVEKRNDKSYSPYQYLAKNIECGVSFWLKESQMLSILILVVPDYNKFWTKFNETQI